MDVSSSDGSEEYPLSRPQTTIPPQSGVAVRISHGMENSPVSLSGAVSSMDIDTSPSSLISQNTSARTRLLALHPEFTEQHNLECANLIDIFFENPTWVRPKPEQVNTPYNEDDSVLTHCIRQQNTRAVVGLLLAGADPNLHNRKGVTPISVAAHKGNIEIMVALIEAGANVNALNNSGSTALIQASHFGNIEAVKLLLKNGATADFANLKGTTALMRASQEGHVEISSLLIEYGADVNRKNHEGMNALMLASQRGHADMVLLLIKARASMDEQTSQGSTALMLACKRGHEKCVQVLVTMGAEIFTKDCRGRTARDTATRRNHMVLLNWLDTQVQVNRMQEYRRTQRSYYLRELRKASQENKLQVDPQELQFVNVLESLYSNSKFSTSMGSLSSKYANAMNESRSWMEKKSSFLDKSLSSESIPVKEAFGEDRPVLKSTVPMTEECWPTVLKRKLPDYQDWQWSKLLRRAMDLPDGIFDLIVDFMPSPRIWQWSLWRLRKRCRLAPHVAINDISKIMDEILCDSNIFSSANQSQLLVRISRDSSLHRYLMQYWDMNQSLVDTLVQWADVQSLSTRASDMEISFKSKLAGNMLNAAISLLKWYRHKTTSIKALEYYSVSTNDQAMTENVLPSKEEDENEFLEATDIGGEDGSDADNIDHETENDMVVDNGDDEFVDSEGDPNEFNSMQMLAMMPPFSFP